MKAYEFLAKYYDELMDDDISEKWSSYVLERVKAYSNGGLGADLGCGSGLITRALNRAGLDVCGVDLSSEMLQKATRKSCDILYINQDIRSLKLNKKMDFITCINDAINYIEIKDIHKTFKKVAQNLKPGGIFMFDISSKYKLENILGNNIYSEDLDDLTYIWYNTLLSDRVEFDIVFFERDGDIYRRKDEHQTQFIHSELDIEKSLEDAGFKLILKEGHLGEKLLEKSDRINFIAKKV